VFLVTSTFFRWIFSNYVEDYCTCTLRGTFESTFVDDNLSI
jgi:hypothetical protein